MIEIYENEFPAACDPCIEAECLDNEDFMILGLTKEAIDGIRNTQLRDELYAFNWERDIVYQCHRASDGLISIITEWSAARFAQLMNAKYKPSIHDNFQTLHDALNELDVYPCH